MRVIPPIRIELFGGLKVILPDREISRFQTQKTGALLAFLTLHRQRTHAREAVAEILWPEADPVAIRNRLNQAISSLRRQLHPPGMQHGAVIKADHHTLAVNSDILKIDVEEFIQLLRQSKSAETELEQTSIYQRAADLYVGDLLDGYYEEWVIPERIRLNELFVGVMNRLVRNYARTGQFDLAIEAAHRLLMVDITEEQYHHNLMKLYIASGHPKSALLQFEELKRSLATLDLTPDHVSNQLRSIAERGETTGVEFEGETALPAAQSVQVVYKDTRTHAVPQLPKYSNPFIGRTAELAAIEKVAGEQQGALISITGVGGIGKTRLAIESAWRLVEGFGGRVLFISFNAANLSEPLAHRICRELKIPVGDHAESSSVELLRRSEKTLILLDELDNFTSDQLQELAQITELCPELQFIVTARKVLNLYGELNYTLSPLSLPSINYSSLQELAKNPSIALFVERAQNSRQDFQLTERTADATVKLCQHLDGLPLALELAASWARSLTVGQMLDQVIQKFDYLESRRKDIHPRHRSIRAAVDGSFQMLSEQSKRLFLRLALLPGSWDHLTAQALLPDVPTHELIAELCDHAIVRNSVGYSESRFEMPQLLRTFGSELLSKDETKEVYWLLYQAFIDRLRHSPALETDEFQAYLQPDIPNILAVCDWLKANSFVQDFEILLSFTGNYWIWSGHLSQGKALYLDLIQSLSIDSSEKDRLAKAHHHLGRIHWFLSEFDEAAHQLKIAYQLFETLQMNESMIACRLDMLLELHRTCRFAEAVDELTVLITSAHELGDLNYESIAYRRLGNCYVELGDTNDALQCYELSLKLAQELGDQSAIDRVTICLAYYFIDKGELDVANYWIQKVINALPQSTHQWLRIDAKLAYSRLLLESDRAGEALQVLYAILDSSPEEAILIKDLLLEFAHAFLALNRGELSSKLFGFLDRFCQQHNRLIYGRAELRMSSAMNLLRDDLGTKRFEGNYSIGKLSLYPDIQSLLIAERSKLLLESV